MPTIITITKEDLLKSKLLEPGWYKARVLQTTTKPAKTDGSTVFTLEMLVTAGPNQKDGSAPAGVKLYRTYSEKATGFATKFFQVLGATIDPNGNNKLDFDAANGRELGVFVKNELNNRGVMQNVVEDFQP